MTGTSGRLARPKIANATKGKGPGQPAHPVLGQWLRIQEWFNESLNQEGDIDGHVEHPPFHLDFMDDYWASNAIAFRTDEYSFVGLTMTLVATLWDVCRRLSRSEAIAALLDVAQPLEECGPLHVLLSQIRHRFIVAHEYTHHVHGHLSPEGTESVFFNEILNSENGNLAAQTFEVAADAYAAFQVLANLDGDWRSQAVGLLRLDTESASVQDQLLFSCFVVGIGAYLFSRRPDVVDSANIYNLSIHRSPRGWTILCAKLSNGPKQVTPVSPRRSYQIDFKR